VFGLAFHIGARVAAKARAGEVLVSSAVKDLMSKSGIRFKDRGVHQLKGLPERWRLYRVEHQGLPLLPEYEVGQIGVDDPKRKFRDVRVMSEVQRRIDRSSNSR
jgi:hypothetical protein